MILYDQSSLLIVTLLFIALLLAIEVSCCLGRKAQAHLSDSARSQVNAIQASLLGVLALLLGFTFSQSLQRFDARSEAVVDEANAIGTAYLRSQLLPASARGEVQGLLAEYLGVRLQASTVPLDVQNQREALLAKSNQQQNDLWHYARKAAAEDDGPVTTGYFIQSLNELIDSYGRRDAAISRHVPEPVILLLFCAFILTGAVVGYASGVEGHRVPVAAYILVLLIALLVFVIIDLDRPRRGLIEVRQESLIGLQDSILAEK